LGIGQQNYPFRGTWGDGMPVYFGIFPASAKRIRRPLQQRPPQQRHGLHHAKGHARQKLEAARQHQIRRKQAA